MTNGRETGRPSGDQPPMGGGSFGEKPTDAQPSLRPEGIRNPDSVPPVITQRGGRLRRPVAPITDQRRTIAMPTGEGEVHADASAGRDAFGLELDAMDPAGQLTGEQRGNLARLRDQVATTTGREVSATDFVAAARTAINRGTQPRPGAEDTPQASDAVLIQAVSALAPAHAGVAVLRYRDGLSDDVIHERTRLPEPVIEPIDRIVRESLAAATGRQTPEAAATPPDPILETNMTLLRQAQARGITAPQALAEELGLPEAGIQNIRAAVAEADRLAEIERTARRTAMGERILAEQEAGKGSLLTPTGNPHEFQIRGGDTVVLPTGAFETPGQRSGVLQTLREGTGLAQSAEQIGEKLGIQDNTVRVRIHELRPILREHGVTIKFDPVVGYYLEHPTTKHIASYEESPYAEAERARRRASAAPSVVSEERYPDIEIDERKVTAIEEALAPFNSADKITKVTNRNALLRALGVRNDRQLAAHLQELEKRLPLEGKKLQRIGSDKEVVYWVEDLPPEEAPELIIMGEYARSGDQQMELTPAELDILNRLHRPAFRGHVERGIDTQTGRPAQSVITSLNNRLAALTGVRETIAFNRVAGSRPFYRVRGVNQVSMPEFNSPSPGQVDNLTGFLEGDYRPEPGAEPRAFRTFVDNLVRLVNRDRAGMQTDQEREAYQRITGVMEQEGMNLYLMIRRMGAALGIPEDQQELSRVAQQLRRPIPSRDFRTIGRKT